MNTCSTTHAFHFQSMPTTKVAGTCAPCPQLDLQAFLLVAYSCAEASLCMSSKTVSGIRSVWVRR